MRFTIDRSLWRCGGMGSKENPSARGLGSTRLLNPEGFLCCLGQVSLQCGVSRQAIAPYASPAGIRVGDRTIPLFILVDAEENTVLGRSAIKINDAEDISDAARETALAELFAAHGHEIEFTGEYVMPPKE